MTSTASINHPQHSGLTAEYFVDRPQAGSVIRGSESDILFIGNLLFRKASPFYYNDRVRVTLFVSDRFRRDYVLLKGLLEFHRTRNLVFTYDRNQSSVSVDILHADIDALRDFLSLVESLLLKEKRFRHALKVALEFENRYRLESESVYSVLRNAL